MTEPTWVLAENIRFRILNLRKHMRLTQKKFATLVGVYPAQVSNWERGERRPSKRRLETLAKSQGWPLSIFEEAGPMPSDIVKWPAEMVVGSQPPVSASGEKPLSPLTSSSPTANPDPDRPRPPQLPEPVFPTDGTCALQTAYDVFKEQLLNRLRAGEITQEEYDDRFFWGNRLAVYGAQDLARATTAKPNGEHRAG